MSVKMSKPQRVLFLVAIMLSSVAIMGELVLVPVIYKFYELYPQNLGAVNTFVSIPTLAMIFASLLASLLLKKFSKKTVLILGGALFAVFGILGAAVDNIWFMLIMRIPYGCGIAFVNVAAMALINEVYTDENKRGAIMGYYTAFIALTGVVMSIVAGNLAVTNWKHVYFVYWAAVPMLSLFIFCLPYIKAEKNSETEKKAVSSEKISLEFWVMIVNYILFNMVYGFIIYFISNYVIENALGNEAFVGIVSSVSSAGSFVFCIFFGKLYASMGRKTIVTSYVIAVLSMLMMYLFPSKAIAAAASFLFGGAYGIGTSFMFSHSPLIVPPSRIDDAMGIVTASYSFGNFLTSYAVTMFMSILKVSVVTPVCLVFAVMSAAYLICELVLISKEDKKKAI